MLEMEEYVDKKYKADYMSLQLWYMTELKQLSIELKEPTVKMAPQGQDKLLHKRLVELNKWIDTQVRPKLTKQQILRLRQSTKAVLYSPSSKVTILIHG